MLTSGQSCCQQIPRTRFDVSAVSMATGSLSTTYAHFVYGAELFDNAHFQISPAEARAIDPQQRLVLETSYSALMIAGESRQSSLDSATGVFVGVMSDGDWMLVRSAPAAGAPLSPFTINGGGTAPLSGLSLLLSLSLWLVATACRNGMCQVTGFALFSPNNLSFSV